VETTTEFTRETVPTWQGGRALRVHADILRDLIDAMSTFAAGDVTAGGTGRRASESQGRRTPQAGHAGGSGRRGPESPVAADDSQQLLLERVAQVQMRQEVLYASTSKDRLSLPQTLQLGIEDSNHIVAEACRCLRTKVHPLLFCCACAGVGTGPVWFQGARVYLR